VARRSTGIPAKEAASIFTNDAPLSATPDAVGAGVGAGVGLVALDVLLLLDETGEGTGVGIGVSDAVFCDAGAGVCDAVFCDAGAGVGIGVCDAEFCGVEVCDVVPLVAFVLLFDKRRFDKRRTLAPVKSHIG